MSDLWIKPSLHTRVHGWVLQYLFRHIRVSVSSRMNETDNNADAAYEITREWKSRNHWNPLSHLPMFAVGARLPIQAAFGLSPIWKSWFIKFDYDEKREILAHCDVTLSKHDFWMNRILRYRRVGRHLAIQNCFRRSAAVFAIARTSAVSSCPLECHWFCPFLELTFPVFSLPRVADLLLWHCTCVGFFTDVEHPSSNERGDGIFHKFRRFLDVWVGHVEHV